MVTKLPSRLYRAHTVRVHKVNCVEVDLDLNFGATLRKHLILESVDPSSIPARQRADANHCMVLILGGQDLIVHTDDSAIDGFLRARVYLDHAVPEGFAWPALTARPFGLDEHRAEVSMLYAWASAQGFDVAGLRAVLRTLMRT